MGTGSHLNPVVGRLANGEPVFLTITPAERGAAIAASALPHDAAIFEMEHAPWDGRELRDSLQYLLDRAAIHSAGSLAPKVAPFIRVPTNGVELGQWHAKQALDSGVYGVVWPHISTVEEAYNAVAACRYPSAAEADGDAPAGIRGFGPTYAARYWGLDIREYCTRADAWPLTSEGDLLVTVMCEDLKAIVELPRMLAEVRGIGAVLLGTADLSMEMGHGGFPHPEVDEAAARVLEICRSAEVACGIPGVTPGNVEQRLEEGFRMILPAPPQSHEVVERGRRWFDDHRR